MAQLILDRTGGFAGGLAAGIESMSSMATNRQRSNLMRQELQQRQKYQQAIQQYGKTGDPEVLKGVDPDAYMKITKFMQEQPSEEIAGLERTFSHMKQFAGAITPQTWPTMKKMFESRGWVKPGTLPDQISQDSLMQMLYAGDIMQAHIKAGATAPKMSGGYFYKPGMDRPEALPPTPAQQAYIALKEKGLGQRERALGIAERGVAERERKGKEPKRPAAHETALQLQDFYEQTLTNIKKNITDPKEQKRQIDELNRRHNAKMAAIKVSGTTTEAPPEPAPEPSMLNPLNWNWSD